MGGVVSGPRCGLEAVCFGGQRGIAARSNNTGSDHVLLESGRDPGCQTRGTESVPACCYRGHQGACQLASALWYEGRKIWGEEGGWEVCCGARGDLAIVTLHQRRVLAAWCLPRATAAKQHSLEISTEPEMMNEGRGLCVCVYVCKSHTIPSLSDSVSAMLLLFLCPYEILPLPFPPFIFSGGKSLPRGRREKRRGGGAS